MNKSIKDIEEYLVQEEFQRNVMKYQDNQKLMDALYSCVSASDYTRLSVVVASLLNTRSITVIDQVIGAYRMGRKLNFDEEGAIAKWGLNPKTVSRVKLTYAYTIADEEG